MIAELVELHDVRDHAQAAGVTSRSQNNALKKMATQVGANMAKQTEAMRKQQTETGKKRTGTVTTGVRQTNTILFAMASGDDTADSKVQSEVGNALGMSRWATKRWFRNGAAHRKRALDEETSIAVVPKRICHRTISEETKAAAVDFAMKHDTVKQSPLTNHSILVGV